MASTGRFALVVEDNDDIARLVQLMLRRMDIENAHAASGFAALALLEERLPDLLLLDINMPGMTGWQVLEAVKDRHPEANFPVIVLTALNDPTNRLIGKLQAQVFCYVTKPFELDALALAVREALGLTLGEG